MFSTFWGSSVATWDFNRLNTNGLMMAFNFFVLASSCFFSMGPWYSFLKKVWPPSKPGLMKVICDQRSSVVFSNGVPVRVNLYLDFNCKTALAILDVGFLITCDSS